LPENGSFMTVDAWLADLRLTPSAWRRRRELFGPLTPEAYADVLSQLRRRLERTGTLAALHGWVDDQPTEDRPRASEMATG
jgi:hypothetical protein